MPLLAYNSHVALALALLPDMFPWPRYYSVAYTAFHSSLSLCHNQEIRRLDPCWFWTLEERRFIRYHTDHYQTNTESENARERPGSFATTDHDYQTNTESQTVGKCLSNRLRTLHLQCLSCSGATNT